MPQLFRRRWRCGQSKRSFVTTVMIVCTLSLAVTLATHHLAAKHPRTRVVDSKTHLSPSLGGSWPGGADWYAAWLGSDALAVVHWVAVIALVLSIYNALKGTLIGVVVYSNLAIYSPDTESKRLYVRYLRLLVGDHLQRSGDADNAVLRNHVALRPHLPPGMPTTCRRISQMGVTMGPPSNFSPSLMIAPALNQLRIAREILHEANGERRHMARSNAGHRIPTTAP